MKIIISSRSKNKPYFDESDYVAMQCGNQRRAEDQFSSMDGYIKGTY